MRGQGSGVRRVLAVLLPLNAALSFVVGAVSLAARQTLYDPATAPDVAARLLDEPAVRLAIAEKLVTRMQTIVPALRDRTDQLSQLAELLTTTEPFNRSFTAAVMALQRDLLEGGAPEVVLHLDGMLAALQDGLIRTGGDLVIPEGQLTGVILIDRDQVRAYRRLNGVTTQTGWPSIAIGAAAAVCAVLVSVRRRGAIFWVGATIAGAAIVALAALALAKSAAAGQARTQKGQDAVDAVWDVVARDIRMGLAVVLLLGLAGTVTGLSLQAFRRGRPSPA
jgi:hypothetical protein